MSGWTPGWYRFGKWGWELVASLDHEPDDTTDLVKVEISDETQGELF